MARCSIARSTFLALNTDSGMLNVLLYTEKCSVDELATEQFLHPSYKNLWDWGEGTAMSNPPEA